MLRVITIESVLFALKCKILQFYIRRGTVPSTACCLFYEICLLLLSLIYSFSFHTFSRPKKPDNPGKAPEDTKANRTHQAANIKGVNTVNFRVNVDFYCLSFWLLRLNKVWLKSNFCFVYCDQIIQQKSSYPLSVIHINLESFQHHPPFICAVHNGMGK